MSIEAINWAVTMNAPSAAAKLVLICLANYAGEDARCWPTVAKLVLDTQLSESAVRDHLHKLIDARLIREDAGTTSSKRAFRLALPGVPMPI